MGTGFLTDEDPGLNGQFDFNDWLNKRVGVFKSDKVDLTFGVDEL